MVEITINTMEYKVVKCESAFKKKTFDQKGQKQFIDARLWFYQPEFSPQFRSLRVLFRHMEEIRCIPTFYAHSQYISEHLVMSSIANNEHARSINKCFSRVLYFSY